MKNQGEEAESSELNALLSEFEDVFGDDMGEMKDFQAILELKQGVVPKCFCPRSVPFALKNAIDTELDHLVHAGVLKKVKSSLWATPILPVPKMDGRLHLC